MDDLEKRVAAMCTAPAGCAFLLHAEAAVLAPEVAARPAIAVHVAAAALNETGWWRGDHNELVARALAEGPRLRGLARDILARPKAAWWFAPVDRTAQLWVPWVAPKGERPDPGRLVTPTGEPRTWECYAQKPEGGLFTSTAVDGTSSALAALTHGAGDHHAEPPLVRIACARPKTHGSSRSTAREPGGGSACIIRRSTRTAERCLTGRPWPASGTAST